MMTFGKMTVGGLPWEMVADQLRTSRVQLGFDARLPKLTAYLDGLGSGGIGQAKLKGVIYDAQGNLFSVTDEVVIPAGMSPAWVDIPFALPGGIEIPAAFYDVGLIAGGDSKVARVFGDDPGVGTVLGTRQASLSGGEVTEALRALGMQGDGRGYTSVYNLVRNGGFEVDTSDWLASHDSGGGDAAISRVAGGATPGSNWALQYGFSVVNQWEYLQYQFTNGKSAPYFNTSQPYTVSFYAKLVSGTSDWQVGICDGSATNFVMNFQNFAPTGAWQRFSFTFTPLQAGVTPLLYIQKVTNTAGTIQLDDVQIEPGLIAHDYIETTGQTAMQLQRERYANVCGNGSFEPDTSGWVTSGPSYWIAASNTTLTRDTSTFLYGSGSGHVQVTPATQNRGISYSLGNLIAGVQYTAQMWVKGSSPSAQLQAFLGENGAASVTALVTPSSSAWQQVTLQWTATGNAAYIGIRTSGSTTADFYVDGVMVEVGSTAHSFDPVGGYVALDSSMGLYVATTNLLSNGGFEAGVSGWADFHPVGAWGQIAQDLTVAKLGLASLRADGLPNQTLTVSGNELTDATRAADVAGDGRGVLVVRNMVANGGFETNVSHWAGWAQGSSPIPTLTRDTSKHQFGSASMRVDTAGANVLEGFIGDNLAIQANGKYTISAYVWATAGQVIRIGLDWKDSGSTFISSSFAEATAAGGGWQRVTATGLTAPSNAAFATPAMYAHNGSPTAVTFWVDGIQVEVGSVANTYVDTSTAAVSQLQATPDGSFGVWEGTTNLIANGGSETNITGWSAGGGVLSQDATWWRFGSKSLLVQT